MKPMGRLAELIEDWKYLVHQEGLRTALPVIGSEIALLPYRHLRFLIVARLLSEPLPELKPKIDLEIRPFQEADLELVRKIHRPSEANLCARRIAHGHKGLVALHQGQLVGYAWGCTAVNPKLERVQLKLEQGDALCTDSYTALPFRGHGVQTALTLARFRLFSNMGYRKAICFIEEHNAPSLAVWQKKFDSLVIGRIDFIRIGPWYRVRFS